MIKLFATTRLLRCARNDRAFSVRSFKKGSALLVAILMMGVLMVLTLGLSDLVISEIRQTTDVVSAGRAYFAAEAGVENALLDLHQNLPGFEKTPPAQLPPGYPCDVVGGYVPVDETVNGIKVDSDLTFDPADPPCYRISSKADSDYNNVPSFDHNQPIFLKSNGLSNGVATNVDFVYSDHPEATYDDLDLSQSAVIPLYSADSTGSGYTNVQNFLVEYYLDFNPDEFQASKIPTSDFNELDVLRWKIFGHPNGDLTRTESISDFFPADYDAGQNDPVCIGNDPTNDLQNNPEYTCKKAIPKNAFFGSARECYGSDAGFMAGSRKGGNTKNPVMTDCSIQSFIASHSQNYLVLTNVVNPDVLLPGWEISDPEASSLFKIHYRIIAEPDPNKRLVRQAAAISAVGYAENGQVKQSIDVNIDQSSFLPVFNFSLYQTCTTCNNLLLPSISKIFGGLP
jgi:hypothetical protein